MFTYQLSIDNLFQHSAVLNINTVKDNSLDYNIICIL